jgi:hypothetical protein
MIYLFLIFNFEFFQKSKEGTDAWLASPWWHPCAKKTEKTEMYQIHLFCTLREKKTQSQIQFNNTSNILL